MGLTARLTGIDMDEALRYMGWHGKTVPDSVRRDVERNAKVVMDAAMPMAVFKLFDRAEDGALSGTSFQPEGKDIHTRLCGCKQVVLLCVTLGADVDAQIRRAQIRNIADAVMLDACASAAIENVADHLCRDIETTIAPARLTDRFSPGYGDMPLDQQSELLMALDAVRRIGVSLTPGGMMIPQKTITALAGVLDAREMKCVDMTRGCRSCARREDCLYRKDGICCE